MASSTRRAWMVAAAAVMVGIFIAIWLLLDKEEPASPTSPGVRDASVPSEDGAPEADAVVAGDDGGAAMADAAVDTRKRFWRRITERRVRKMQRRHSALFSLCFKRAARTSGNLPRKVNIVLRLKPGGVVRSVSVTPATSPALRQCLVRMIRAWRFPSDARAQQIAFPIVFAQ